MENKNARTRLEAWSVKGCGVLKVTDVAWAKHHEGIS